MPFSLNRETDEAKDAYIEFVRKAALGAAVITKLRKDFEAKFPHVTSEDIENWTEDCFRAFKEKRVELEEAAEKVLSGKGLTRSRTSPPVPLTAKIQEALNVLILHMKDAVETKFPGKLVGADVRNETEKRLQKEYPGAKLQSNYNQVPVALTDKDKKAGRKTSSIKWICLGDAVKNPSGKLGVDKEVDMKATLDGITTAMKEQSTEIKADFEKTCKKLYDQLTDMLD